MVKKEWFRKLLERLLESEKEATQDDEKMLMVIIMAEIKEVVNLEYLKFGGERE